MRLYRIRRRNGVWQVLSGDTVIAESEEREKLVRLARKIASRYDGEIYVSDEGGELQTSYFYAEGLECIRLLRLPRLRIVRD
jgi:hypothetical protein